MRKLICLAIALTLSLILYGCHSKGKMVGDLKSIDGAGPAAGECTPPIKEFTCPAGAKLFSGLSEDIGHYEMYVLIDNVDMKELSRMSFGDDTAAYDSMTNILLPNLSEPAVMTIVCKPMPDAKTLMAADGNKGKSLLEFCDEYALAFEGEFSMSYPSLEVVCTPESSISCPKEIDLINRDGFMILGTKKFVTAAAGTGCLFQDQLERMPEVFSAAKVSKLGFGKFDEGTDVAAEALHPGAVIINSFSAVISSDQYVVNKWTEIEGGAIIAEEMFQGEPDMVKHIAGSTPSNDKDYVEPQITRSLEQENGLGMDVKMDNDLSIGFMIYPPLVDGKDAGYSLLLSESATGDQNKIKFDFKSTHENIDKCELIKMKASKEGDPYKVILPGGFQITFDAQALSLIRMMDDTLLNKVISKLTGAEFVADDCNPAPIIPR